MRQLHRCEFLENAQNAVLVGQLGEGGQTNKGEAQNLTTDRPASHRQPRSVLNGNPGQISTEIDIRSIDRSINPILSAKKSGGSLD